MKTGQSFGEYTQSPEVLASLVRARKCQEYGKAVMLASNVRSNSKLNFDHIPPDSLAGHLFGKALASKLVSYQPDLLISVPAGPDGHVPYLAHRLHIPYALLDKPIRRGKLPRIKEEYRALIARSHRIALVEDVLSTGKSTQAVARLVGEERVVVAGAFIDRGHDVDGIETLEQTQDYMQSNPSEAMPHIHVSYPREAALTMPVPLWIVGLTGSVPQL